MYFDGTDKPIRIYAKMKRIFPSHIIFIQNGCFYEVYKDDADFCSDFFGWKIWEDNSIKKSGTPTDSNLFRVKLRRKNQEYIIIVQDPKDQRNRVIRKIYEIFPPIDQDSSGDVDIEYLIDKADEHESNEEYERAIDCYNEVLTKKYDHATAWNNKGFCLHKLQRYEDALESYIKALQIEPDDVIILLNIGAAYHELKRYDEALDCFSKATQLEPTNFDGWCYKGDILKDLGKNKEAVDCFDKALKIDPENGYALEQKEYVEKMIVKESETTVFLTRNEAEKKLKKIFGFDNFKDVQWKTIDLLFQGKRVLLIEKTGYGKSLCYQFPATQFDGLTVIFSPLIALMRDQVRTLKEKGIAAAYINSEQSPEENSKTIKDAMDGKFKILYIAPERQENQDWIDATRKMKLAMVVIDEAHTISQWGHDFRPSFRRIINLVQLLPKDLPVLATTATATIRVQKDIEKQIAGEIQTIRGTLSRHNLILHVIIVQSEDEKFLWLAENLKDIQGTGIIYTGTRTNTEIYSRWLEYMGIQSKEYNAGLDGDTRKKIENEWMNDEVKCVVSTNALGMGIDKKNIRFIIHTQIPVSPIHYYQEIGRAGRDGKDSRIILFYNSKTDRMGIPEDIRLPRSFINNAKPATKHYDRVIDVLKEEPLGRIQLGKKTNLKQRQIRTIVADLIDQGIVNENNAGRYKKYEYKFDAALLDTKNFEELRRKRLEELDAMVKYVETQKPRMKYLCEFLEDIEDPVYNNCDNSGYKKIILNSKEETREKLRVFRETYFPVLEVEATRSNLMNGFAASYYGVSTIGSTLHRCKYETQEDFPDHILKLTLKAYNANLRDQDFDIILYVPPTCSGDLVKNFALKLSQILNIPISHKLIKIRETKPQKIFKTNFLKHDNVSKAFSYSEPSEIKGKRILLVDDIFDSGATIKEIGRLLTNLGASSIVPLVIAKTVGGDIDE